MSLSSLVVVARGCDVRDVEVLKLRFIVVLVANEMSDLSTCQRSAKRRDDLRVDDI